MDKLPSYLSSHFVRCSPAFDWVIIRIMQVSSGLGQAMVGISDIRNDVVNFRDREGGGADANPGKTTAQNCLLSVLHMGVALVFS